MQFLTFDDQKGFLSLPYLTLFAVACLKSVSFEIIGIIDITDLQSIIKRIFNINDQSINHPCSSLYALQSIIIKGNNIYICFEYSKLCTLQCYFSMTIMTTFSYSYSMMVFSKLLVIVIVD